MLALDFLSVRDTPVAGVGKDIGFSTMQQRMGLGDVVRIGRCGDHGVNQSGVGIRTDVGFHAVVPLVAFFGLVHIGVARPVFVLGGAGRGDEGGIYGGAGFEQQAALLEQFVDGVQDALGQFVLLQLVTKAQYGALVRLPAKGGLQLASYGTRTYPRERMEIMSARRIAFTPIYHSAMSIKCSISVSFYKFVAFSRF